jgi:drug/metabolite transporter, DME family
VLKKWGAARTGYLEVLGAASLWGSSGIFSVALFRRGMDPAGLALWRPWIGVLFLIIGVWLFRPGAFRVPARGLFWMAGVGGLATAVFQVAYQMSTEAVGVPTTVALLYLAPALVLAAAGPLLAEPPSRRQIGLATVSVVGVWLTVVGARDAELHLSVEGLLWGFAAAASYASYTLLGRYAAPRWGSVPTVLHATWGACVLLAITVPLLWGRPALPADGLALILLGFYGLLTVAVAAFLFYDALGRIPAGHVSILATVEPVVAALLATVLVDQGLTPLGWLGLALVVTGVAGASRTAAT